MPRVLCADDDAHVRAFLERAMRSGGYDVELACSGTQAIRLLDRGCAFDLLITDHTMPGATGLEVIEHAHRINPTLPSLIVTAHHDLDLATRAMRAGAVGFLPKPFRADHLLTVAANALQRRELAAEATRLSLLVPMLERFTVVLANTLESKDCATHRHAERLVAHAEAVAVELGLSASTRASLRIGAALHDIGKVGVPEELLRRAGPLSEAEREVMQLHPEIGAAILEDVDTWEDVRLIVRHHHERWDGGGYPLRLRGTEAPLGARIVSVVDAFDVITSGRPYATARPPEEALAELRRERGAQFDPDVVDAFVLTVNRAPVYHGSVDAVFDMDLIARRAVVRAAPPESLVGEAIH